jgi:BMFP domain-containing protein YqiC
MAFGITELRHHLDARLDAICNRLDHLERILTDMPTRAEFDAAKAVLLQSITDAATRVTTDIQALRDQLANGNPVSDQDLADLQTDVTAVGAIDPVAVPPPTP